MVPYGTPQGYAGSVAGGTPRSLLGDIHPRIGVWHLAGGGSTSSQLELPLSCPSTIRTLPVIVPPCTVSGVHHYGCCASSYATFASEEAAMMVGLLLCWHS